MHYEIHTCESFKPSFAANFFLSGLLMYFCFWNIFSRPFLCMSENTARLSIPLRGFPRMLLRKVNALGTGSKGESETKSILKIQLSLFFQFLNFYFFLGFVVNILIFIYFLVLNFYLQLLKCQLNLRVFYVMYFGYLVPCTFVEVIYFFQINE